MNSYVYLCDEGEDGLVVKEGLGEAGMMLKEAKHSIPLSAERSLVARAGRTLEPVVVSDVTVSPDHLPNPLLPETRYVSPGSAAARRAVGRRTKAPARHRG